MSCLSPLNIQVNTIDMDNYKNLLQNFKNIAEKHINSQILNTLKNKYENIINSKRGLEDIVNISSLLNILEKRNILQYSDISTLKFIAQFIKDKIIEELILSYELWSQENITKINNLYNNAIICSQIPAKEDTRSTREYFSELISTNCTSSTRAPLTVNTEKHLQYLVTKKVSKEIGKNWAEVSRRLNLRECDIEEIELNCIHELKKYEKMFNQALNLYFSENHENWKRELMQALELSRRKDLKEMVEEIVYP